MPLLYHTNQIPSGLKKSKCQIPKNSMKNFGDFFYYLDGIRGFNFATKSSNEKIKR
jgi:hypothetical protein